MSRGRNSLPELSEVSSLTIEPLGGASVYAVAWEAMLLSKALGVEVFFIHNGTRYQSKFTFEATERQPNKTDQIQPKVVGPNQ